MWPARYSSSPQRSSKGLRYQRQSITRTSGSSMCSASHAVLTSGSGPTRRMIRQPHASHGFRPVAVERRPRRIHAGAVPPCGRGGLRRGLPARESPAPSRLLHGCGRDGNHPPHPDQDRGRQPRDATPRHPRDGGRDPRRDRRPRAAGVRRRCRGVDDARSRLRTRRMAPVHEHRRDSAGAAALARRSGSRLHPDDVRGTPGHPPRLRPAARHSRRRGRGERADDGGCRRVRRRCAARRARQP